MFVCVCLETMSGARELLLCVMEAKGVTAAEEGQSPMVYATITRSGETTPILQTSAVPGTRDPSWKETLHLFVHLFSHPSLSSSKICMFSPSPFFFFDFQSSGRQRQAKR